jgi:hypothetical protein
MPPPLTSPTPDSFIALSERGKGSLLAASRIQLPEKFAVSSAAKAQNRRHENIKIAVITSFLIGSLMSNFGHDK